LRHDRQAPREPDAIGDDQVSSRRIDRWLWTARLVRTRSAAAALVQSGRIRLFRSGSEWVRVNKPSLRLAPRDVLTMPLGRNVRVVEVLGFAVTRGAAAHAQLLYADLTGRGALCEGSVKGPHDAGLERP